MGSAAMRNAAASQSAREPRDVMQVRADRAAALAHLGELSAAAQALTAEPLAAGDEETLAKLRDPIRRPQIQQMPLAAGIVQFQAARRVRLSWERFLANLRGARRGSAAGPSGCTNDHLRILLDDERC